jgi:hypothetical protein
VSRFFTRLEDLHIDIHILMPKEIPLGISIWDEKLMDVWKKNLNFGEAAVSRDAEVEDAGNDLTHGQ